MTALSRRTFLGSSAAATGGLVMAGSPVWSGPVNALSTPNVQLAAPKPFTHIVARWKGGHDALVQVRHASEQTLSEWVELTVSEDASEMVEDGLVRTAPLGVGETQFAEARVVKGLASDIELLAIDTGLGVSSVVDVRAKATDGIAKAVSVGIPSVISRAQWGADESIRRSSPAFAPISKLIVHHSDTANGDPDPAATVRAIYQFHVQGNGWDDIGYNYLIDESGRIYEGRYSRPYGPGEIPTAEDPSGNGVVGAHALAVNAGSVGVCLLGTFTGQLPTSAAIDSLVSLLIWKASVHNLDVNGSSPLVTSNGTVRTFQNVSGHRDTYATSCPGNAFYSQLPTIRSRVSSGVVVSSSARDGYWTATRAGAVTAFGLSQNFGSMAGRPLNQPVISLRATRDGLGYWLLGADGGIFSFGDAAFFGSTGGLRLNKPVVGLSPTGSGLGYWLVASDGGIFTFGDAGFYGSTGSMRLNQPVVGMASTSSGRGYWLVASDGGIFCFGDASFLGSTGSLRLARPVVGMAATPTGRGYWLVASDGGVFCFGDAQFHGSAATFANRVDCVDISSTESGQGYWVLSSNGSVYCFGDADNLGSVATANGSSVGLARRGR